MSGDRRDLLRRAILVATARQYGLLAARRLLLQTQGTDGQLTRLDAEIRDTGAELLKLQRDLAACADPD